MQETCGPCNAILLNFEDLTVVARGVGAKLTVEEVILKCSWPSGVLTRDKIVQGIVSHLENQKEQLVYTEFIQVYLGTPAAYDLFFPLLKVSKKWKVGMLVAVFAPSLARFPTDVVAAGQIGKMHIMGQKLEMDNLDALRRFWEVTAKLIIHHGGVLTTTVGGGKGENPDADWQRVLDFLLMPSEDEDEGEDGEGSEDEDQGEDGDEGEGEDEGEDGDRNND